VTFAKEPYEMAGFCYRRILRKEKLSFMFFSLVEIAVQKQGSFAIET